jgi:hypothetical protein
MSAAIKAALRLVFFGAEAPSVHGAFTSLDFLRNLLRVQCQPLVSPYTESTRFFVSLTLSPPLRRSTAKLCADGILQSGGGTSDCPAAGPAGAAPVRQRRGRLKMKVILNSFLNI